MDVENLPGLRFSFALHVAVSASRDEACGAEQGFPVAGEVGRCPLSRGALLPGTRLSAYAG